MKTRTAIAVLIGLAAIVGGAAYLGSPFLALRNLQTAAYSGNRDKLEALVDFPAVRQGVKDQLNAAVVREMRKDPEMADNPFAALGVALAPQLVNGLVEAYVTPDAVAQMIRTGERPGGEARPARPRPAPGKTLPPNTGPPREGQPKVSYGYKGGLDRFETRIGDDGGALTFQLQRTGLFGWRLMRIELPLDKP